MICKLHLSLLFNDTWTEIRILAVTTSLSRRRLAEEYWFLHYISRRLIVACKQDFALYFGSLVFLKLFSMMQEVQFKLFQVNVSLLYPLTL